MSCSRNFLLACLVFCFQNSIAQAPNIQWAKCFGGSDRDQAFSIIQTAEGSFVVAGWSNSNDGDVSGNHSFSGIEDMWLIKLDSFGNLINQKCLGGSVAEGAHSIKQTYDGGFIIAGYASSDDYDVSGLHCDSMPCWSFGGYEDFWVVKTDSTFDIQWQKCLGGTYLDYAWDCHQTNDSGYVVIGNIESVNGDITGYHGGGDYWIVKLDISGNIQWQKALGGSGNEKCYSLVEDIDGGFLILGGSNSNDYDVSGNHGGGDYWLVKVDQTGNLQWQRCYGGSNGDGAGYVDMGMNREFLLAGNSNSTNGDVSGNIGSGDWWIVRIDSIGGIIHQKCYGGLSGEGVKSIKSTTDGGFVAVGETASNDSLVFGNHGYLDIYINKADSIGNIEWYKCIGGSGLDFASSIIQTSDGGYVLAGYTESDDGDVSGYHGIGCFSCPEDFWVVKLAPLGLAIPEPLIETIDVTSYLASNGLLSVKFFSKNTEYINISILNATGEVSAEKEIHTQGGLNKAEFSTFQLAAGIYFVKLQGEGSFGVQKVFIGK